MPHRRPLSFSLNAFFRLTFASQRMGALTFTWQWAYGNVSRALRTGICKGERRIFFFFFTVPYLFSIQTYRLPLQPPTSRLATHLGSERLNESRQNCTAFLTHRKIMHFNGIAGQFISLVCKMLWSMLSDNISARRLSCFGSDASF